MSPHAFVPPDSVWARQCNSIHTGARSLISTPDDTDVISAQLSELSVFFLKTFESYICQIKSTTCVQVITCVTYVHNGLRSCLCACEHVRPPP